MTTFDDQKKFFIAGLALLLPTGIASIAVASCTCCYVRRANDTARRWTTYHQAAFTLFAVYVVLYFCLYALELATVIVSHDYYDGENVSLYLFRAANHLNAIGPFFNNFAVIYVFLTLVNLGTELRILHEGRPPNRDRVLRIAAYGIAVLLFILAVAELAILEYIATTFYSGDFFDGISDSTITLLDSSRKLTFGLIVLFFVLAIHTLAWTILVKYKTRNIVDASTATTYLVVCAVLWLMSMTFYLADYAKYVNLNSYDNDPPYDNFENVLYVIFGIWPVFILLCILFALGVKHRNGVWSSQPPFAVAAPGAPGVVPPQGYTYYAQYQQQAYTMPPQQYYAQELVAHPVQNVPYELSSKTPAIPSQQPIAPPEHHEAFGLNHQANGISPPSTTGVYEKPN